MTTRDVCTVIESTGNPLGYVHSTAYQPVLTVVCALQSAECREHKRWIDRENQRLRAKAKKEETRRIREFVDRAYKLDPRVIAHKEEVREARDARKAAKVC